MIVNSQGTSKKTSPNDTDILAYTGQKGEEQKHQ